jgi:hypothetical protein
MAGRVKASESITDWDDARALDPAKISIDIAVFPYENSEV